MSAFKRYQSKVFWNQMQQLDIPSGHVSGAHSLPLLFEDSTDSSKDITCDENITVIRRDQNADQLEELSKSRREDSSEIGNRSSQGRPYSPASQGHRSQDSGFSDSDRSECSDVEARRRHRRSRHRRRNRRKHGAEIVNALRSPALTSTPKQEPRLMERDSSLARQHADISKTRWDLRQLDGVEENDSEISNIESREETIKDFLFEEELVENQSPNSSLWSRSEHSRATSSLAERTLYSCGSSSCSSDVSLSRLAPVRAWLCNIAHTDEDENEPYLFDKSLPRPALTHGSEDRNMANLTSSSTTAATKLLVRVEKFDQHFNRVTDKLSTLKNVRVERELITSIEEDAYKLLTSLGAPPPRRVHQGSLQSITQQLQSMKSDVEKALEPRLDYYIDRIVRSLDDWQSEEKGGVRGAIATLSALGMAGSRACRSIARCSGVRNLLTLLPSTTVFSEELRCAALRALACVCSCPEAIEALLLDDGAELLAEILASRFRSETEKTEAAALIVQISAPWSNAQGVESLSLFADSLVRDLTELAAKTSCSQTLLLSAAAFNYLASHRKFIQPIIEHETLRTLFCCVKKSAAAGNVCLMEQVASLVGELARDPSSLPHLATSRASVALVSFLKMRPASLEESYQRLQATASAALARMCVHEEIAKQLVFLGAADCLPPVENKDSDEDENTNFRMRCSKSLRLACREAAEQIDAAQSVDRFTF